MAEGGDHEGQLLGGCHARTRAGQPYESEGCMRNVHAVKEVVVWHLPVLVLHLRVCATLSGLQHSLEQLPPT